VATKLTISDTKTLAYALRFLSELNAEKKWSVTICKYTEQRTLSQNALMWDWLATIGKNFGYEKEEIHEVMMRKFLKPHFVIIDDVEYEVYSTKKLSKHEFGDYMNSIDRFAASEGIVLRRPEDQQLRS